MSRLLGEVAEVAPHLRRRRGVEPLAHHPLGLEGRLLGGVRGGPEKGQQSLCPLPASERLPSWTSVWMYSSQSRISENMPAACVNMPSAASEMPYMPARRCEPKMMPARMKTGRTTDLYPSASPKMMFVAAPVRHDSDT